MTFQLQHPSKVWDEEITTDKWPLPPAKPWAPKSSIEQMCEAAMLEVAAWVELYAEWHANCITLAFDQARVRFGVPYVESFSMANPDGSLMKVTMEWQ